MNVHYTWSRSIQSDTSRTEVIKALYKCDSLNTLLSDNLIKATKKDSAQTAQNLFLSKKLNDKDADCEIEKKKEIKKQKKRGRTFTFVLATIAFVVGLTI